MVKETLAAKAYRIVREDIRNSRIKPGETIVENDICKRCNISKATARDVLHRLDEEGIMRILPRVGYQLNIYDDADFLKIQKLRYALESLVIRRLVVGVDTDSLRERFTEIATMDNYTFHTALANLTGDAFIMDSLERLLLKVGTIYGNIPLNPEDEAAIVRRHIEIIACLSIKDEQSALRALRTDLRINQEYKASVPV